MMDAVNNLVGVVAIGRNEGLRLVRCLESARAQVGAIVYVDSGSADESVKEARRLGAEVVELDMGVPFTAARARNEGVERLREKWPGVEFVQVVDGDCQIVEGWIGRAVEELRKDPKLAIVCGRRREQFPERSIYNKLCDIEWASPIGVAKACGGDCLIRLTAFGQVGGYNGEVIAGEEPEMCVRLREAGWTILRIDAEMTVHDAAMTRFGQWWKRALRAGHAYAEGNARHGRAPERFRAREVRSICIWGLMLPLLAIALAWPMRYASVAIAALYPVMILKIARGKRRGGWSWGEAWLYGRFVVLGKFPQVLGMIKYWRGRWTGKRSAVIEYKGARRKSVAYLAAILPAPSETFVYREIRELRHRGWGVQAVSLNEPVQAGAAEFDDLKKGLMVVYGSQKGRTVGAMMGEMVLHPVRSAGTICVAMGDAAWPGEAMGVSGRVKLVGQAMAGMGLARRLRGAGVEHIHCHFAHAPASVGMYAARQLGIPFSFTGHANDLFQRRALLKRKLQRAKFVACISEWHREFYRGIENANPRKYVVIRCGVDVGQWRAREAGFVAGEAMEVLTVCRLVEKKGVDTLIEAMAGFGKRTGGTWRLTVAGDGPERERLVGIAERLGCGGSVRWLGGVSNDRVRELLATSDALVLACRTDSSGDRDGIPVVLMEAMACGVPVISGDLPAIRELIDGATSGLLVPGGDVSKLAEAIARLRDDGELRKCLSIGGRAVIEREFALEENVTRLEEVVASCQ